MHTADSAAEAAVAPAAAFVSENYTQRRTPKHVFFRIAVFETPVLT